MVLKFQVIGLTAFVPCPLRASRHAVGTARARAAGKPEGLKGGQPAGQMETPQCSGIPLAVFATGYQPVVAHKVSDFFEIQRQPTQNYAVSPKASSRNSVSILHQHFGGS